MNRNTDPILIGLPSIPSSGKGHPSSAEIQNFFRAVAAMGDIHLCPVGPSSIEQQHLQSLIGRDKVTIVGADSETFFSNLKRAISEVNFSSVLLIDHPLTAKIFDPLASFAPHLPVILVRFNGASASVRKTKKAPQGREHQRMVMPLDARREIWYVYPSSDSGWLQRRLKSLRTRAQESQSKHQLASIIIPCWNNLRYTRECVESIFKWTSQPFELILIDNGSTDGTDRFAKTIAKKYPSKVRIITNKENMGFGKAINQGMSLSRGQYVVWLNNDAVVTPHWLDRMIRCADRAWRIGAVGPCSNEIEGIQRVPIGYKSVDQLPNFAEAWAMQRPSSYRTVHRLTGFCLLLKKEAISQVGMLDDRFETGYYEDFDYCLRLRHRGYDLVLAEDVFIHHYGHTSIKDAEFRSRHMSKNREIFIDKWCRRVMEYFDELDPELAHSIR